MGKSWGNLYYIRNIVYYRLSSYEQRAFPNFFKESITNVFNDFKKHVVFIAPPAAIYYLVYRWSLTERERMVRKDPKLIKDD